MKGKILIIDDDRVTLTMLKMVLSRHGHHVLSAKDGEEGWELASREKPDVVISDILIPKIHGLDLCARIKKDAELKDIKVILMTAVYKGTAFKSEAKDSGADYFIEKPLNTKELLEKLENSL